MTKVERQELIVSMLRKEHRCISINRLATAFGCTKKTINRDITELSVSLPLVTTLGRNGGVQLAEWYQPRRHTLCQEQIEALRSVMNSAAPDIRATLGSIIDQFGPK